MKGSMTITAKGENELNFRGSFLMHSELDKYRLISGLAKCLGVDTPKAWAECIMYCLAQMDDKEGLERTEIVLPVKEESNGTGEN